MKEMIKRVREEKGGFTLAELLIVVAIILVLVAIAIPVFTGAQNSAKEATHDANIRAAKSATMVYVLENNVDLGTNKAYEAKGEVSATGDIEITAVTGVAAAGKDTLGKAETDTTGPFTVYLTDTKVPAKS
ncbi:MAG: type II secretion system protein [Gordonibacter sp.]|uniref:type II secretion system protein n=1 Tax=Gordonibacter sp. TaxID=1968902 RepID=UPI002FCAD99B